MPRQRFQAPVFHFGAYEERHGSDFREPIFTIFPGWFLGFYRKCSWGTTLRMADRELPSMRYLNNRDYSICPDPGPVTNRLRQSLLPICQPGVAGPQHRHERAQMRVLRTKRVARQ